ncbi:MAG TPA: endonuclease V [candidate division Zixibacteria bacterium]|nr:endonuclease V [candidate division Zixibacteria bacterium]
MELVHSHPWATNKYEAIEIQRELAKSIEILPNYDDINYIASVDTAYGKNADIVFASAVLCTFPEIEEVERRSHYGEVSFPYIPGMFYFREGPTIIKALEKLNQQPDLLIVHGHGIAHVKNCGVASMIGVGFDIPSIGCSRKLLTGFVKEIPSTKGSSQPIIYRDREVGIAYRTKDNVKPLFISPGHKCDIPFARDIVVRNLRGYRMPEPLRFAHLSANKYKRYIEKKFAAKPIYLNEANDE